MSVSHYNTVTLSHCHTVPLSHYPTILCPCAQRACTRPCHYACHCVCHCACARLLTLLPRPPSPSSPLSLLSGTWMANKLLLFRQSGLKVAWADVNCEPPHL